MDTDSFKSLLKFLKTHECFKHIKLAVVTNNSGVVVFPMIGELQECELKIKPFSTFDAATEWIME